MDIRIASLPDAPLPLDPDSYYEVLVPDGASATGYTSCKIKPKDINGKYYFKGLITQTSGNPSVDTVSENVGAISFTKDSAGYYKSDFTALLAALGTTYDKVIYSITNNIQDTTKSIRMNLRNDNVFEIWTHSSGTLTDGILAKTPLIIEIYI